MGEVKDCTYLCLKKYNCCGSDLKRNTIANLAEKYSVLSDFKRELKKIEPEGTTCWNRSVELHSCCWARFANGDTKGECACCGKCT